MLITERPYVSHILKPLEGTIEQFAKPVNQDGLKGSEKKCNSYSNLRVTQKYR